MDILVIFGIIAAIIGIGWLGELVFERTRVPDVFFLIIIGIILGVLGKVGPDTFDPWATVFTTFTLVFLLFQSALNIKLSSLFSSLSRATALTVLSFILTVAAVTAMGLFIPSFSFQTALLLGMILGGTSSAVIIPLVKGLKLQSRYGLVLTLESALSDVLTIIGSVTVVAIIITGDLSGPGIFKTILSSFSLAVLLGIVASIAWIFVLARFPRVNNSYMLTIAALISLYAFVESPFVGASGAIAALVFGLVLGNSKPILRALHSIGLKVQEEEVKKNVLSRSALNFYEEISFFVKVFFFVYLGILIDFSQPFVFLVGAGVVVIMYVVRPLAVWLSFWGEKVDDVSRVAMQVLIPKGLAAAVLAQLAVQQGVPGAELIVGVVLSAILLSIVLTSTLVFLSQKGFRGLYAWGRK